MSDFAGIIRLMAWLKAHFDGSSIVLDEPATLSVGQALRVVIDPDALLNDPAPARKSLAGFAKGMFEMCPDFNEPLDEFVDYR